MHLLKAVLDAAPKKTRVSSFVMQTLLSPRLTIEGRWIFSLSSSLISILFFDFRADFGGNPRVFAAPHPYFYQTQVP